MADGIAMLKHGLTISLYSRSRPQSRMASEQRSLRMNMQYGT